MPTRRVPAEEEPIMPLVRISIRRGQGPAYRQAVADAVHAALVETFAVPADDRFQILTEHEAGTELLHTPRYLGIEYSPDLVMIQITANNTRGVEQKKRLYRRIVERLGDKPGLRPQDVMISLVEVAKENWSFGLGEAQYA
jgi:phenylpyruvate tautomerase PptA (4-oxalocrotonate tautomerase family)